MPKGGVTAIAGMMVGDVVLLHGALGRWDEYALLLLAPLVVAAVLWVTRRREEDADDEPEVVESGSVNEAGRQPPETHS